MLPAMSASLPDRGDLVIAFSVAFALLPVAALYVARWWLDRGRSEPPWAFPLLLLFGGAGGLFFALVGFAEVANLFAFLYGPDAAAEPLLYNAVVAPAAEELGKAFILLVFLLTRWYRGPVDGLLYGWAAGAGFACVESFAHFATAYVFQGTTGWFTEVALRAGPAVVVHGSATAAVGAFLGLARFDGRPAVAVLAPVCGVTVALGIHGGWNALLFLSATTLDPDYENLAYLAQPAVLVGVAVALVAALGIEVRALEGELASEVAEGRLSVHELAAVLNRRERRRPAWLRLGSGRAALVGAALQLGLALRRYRREGRGAGHVDRLRRDLRAARRPPTP